MVRADEHEIAITNTGFVPDELTVRVGEPVTWTNATTIEHAILTADGMLDSGPIGPGEAFGHVFEQPGAAIASTGDLDLRASPRGMRPRRPPAVRRYRPAAGHAAARLQPRGAIGVPSSPSPVGSIGPVPTPSWCRPVRRQRVSPVPGGGRRRR